MKGYLYTENVLDNAQAEELCKKWNYAMEHNITPLLTSGIRFFPLQNNETQYPVIVKCGYCGQFGAVKTECRHCGAAILE